MSVPLVNIVLTAVNTTLAVRAHKRSEAVTDPKAKSLYKFSRNIHVFGAIVGVAGTVLALTTKDAE